MIDDEQLVALWLNGRPQATQANYRREITKLKASKAGALKDVTLGDLQAHIATLAHLAPRSRGLAVAAIKSFYAFHLKLGTMPTNPALALLEPTAPNDLAERILSESDTQRLIEAAASPTERLILLLLYHTALRASELCGLRWRHAVARGEGEGQLTVTGKGGKTRTILLSARLWGELAVSEPDDAKPSDPIFPSVTDPARPIGKRQLLRIVKAAAAAAGLSPKISPHFLRHSHASHALAAGCPLTLIRDQLGHASISTTDRYLHSQPGESSGRFLR